MKLGSGFFAYFFEFSDARHPDSEELIQVGRVDGQKFKPFQQRYCGVFGFLEHPIVEGEPGDVALSIGQRLQW
jgi:hypothetical protein